MAIKHIQNMTILANVGESVTLPNPVIARNDDGSYTSVSVTWNPPSVTTAQAGDYVFVGKVSGYVPEVLCSVIVGGISENPESTFPSEIDEFGNPKVDIQTADIPDIDDFQYFKSKYPRSVVEGYQLQQLRELLADKVILARDINHLRNAVIEIEKFLKKLEEEIEDLKKRVEKLEQETVIGGNNVGSGEGVFKDVANRIMNFKSLKGEGGVSVTSSGDEISIGVDIPPPPAPTAGCDVDVKGKSFTLCDDTFPMRIEKGSIDITNSGSFGLKMINLKNGGFWSSLFCLGQGIGTDGRGSGRILKTDTGFIFEVKGSSDRYVGLQITVGIESSGSGDITTWYSDSTSRVNASIDQSISPIKDAYNMSQISGYSVT